MITHLFTGPLIHWKRNIADFARLLVALSWSFVKISSEKQRFHGFQRRSSPITSCVNPVLQAEGVQELALVHSPQDLGEAVKVLVRSDSHAIMFLEGAIEQGDGNIPDLAEGEVAVPLERFVEKAMQNIQQLATHVLTPGP